MKKYLYLASCLLVGMTLSLSSCSDDDPILPTPEEPEQPEQPEKPETRTTNYYEIKLNYKDVHGDSLAFLNFAERIITSIQESAKPEKSSLVIYMTKTQSIAIYDSLATKDVANKAHDVVLESLRQGQKPQGFVYSGTFLIKYGKIDLNDTSHTFFSSSSNGKCQFPNLSATIWTASDTQAEISALDFKAKTVILPNDSIMKGEYMHVGYDITFKADDAEKYLFRLNKEGTEIQLVKADGKEIENGPTYTNPVFSGN